MGVRRPRKRARKSASEISSGSFPVPTKPGLRTAFFAAGLPGFSAGEEIENGEPAKPSGIDEADFATVVELENRVGVGGERLVWIADQQAARHPKMNEPLCQRKGFCAGLWTRATAGAVWGKSVPHEIDDNMFAHAADALDGAAGKGVDDIGGLGAEWLRFGAQPDRHNGAPAHSLIDPAGDGLDLWQFRHLLTRRPFAEMNPLSSLIVPTRSIGFLVECLKSRPFASNPPEQNWLPYPSGPAQREPSSEPGKRSRARTKETSGNE